MCARIADAKKLTSKPAKLFDRNFLLIVYSLEEHNFCTKACDLALKTIRTENAAFVALYRLLGLQTYVYFFYSNKKYANTFKVLQLDQ